MKASTAPALALHKRSLRAAWLLLLLLLPAFSVLAQSGKKKCVADCSCDMAGKVVDQQTKEPLPYATVQLKGTSVGTITDEEGVFHLHNLCADEFDLQVSFVGYKTVVHHHDLYHQDPVIYLSPADVQLESIVVEGQRIESGLASATVTTLDARELERSQGDRLGDALSRLPGVTTLNTGQNIVKPVVHGLHSSRILIINNGVRHESQSWGAEHAPEIDPNMASSMRLIKGAAAVKYGPGALGGVIIIDPPQPDLTTSLRGNAALRLQSNGRSLGNSFFLQQGYSNFAWVAQAAGLYQGDLHAPDYQLSNTGAREYSASAGALYHRGRLDLNLHYSYFRQKLGILRGSVVGNLNDLAYAIDNEPPAYTEDFSYQINTPYQQVSHHLAKLEGTYSLRNSSLHFQYAFQANQRQEYDVRRGTNNEIPSINLELFTQLLEAEWKHPALGPFNGAVGLQAQFQDNNNIPGTNTAPFLPNYNNFNIGFSVAESVHLGENIVDAGLRFDLQQASVRGRDNQNEIFRDELRYQSLTASLGLLRPLSAWASFQTNLGMAWRPPNMAELYSFGKHETIIEYGLLRFHDGRAGVFTDAERPIDSELSYKWVNTYTYEQRQLSVELTAYANYLQNYIYTRPLGLTTTSRGPFPFFIHDQTDALLSGLDGSFSYQHAPSWSSSLRGMLLIASDVRKRERFVGIPPNRLAYELEYSRERIGAFNNLQASLETSYVFKQYQAPAVIAPETLLKGGTGKSELIANATGGFDLMEAPEGYFLLNLFTSIDRGRLSYRLGVRNLLNTSYREYTNRQRYFADEPGRNFLFSVKYSF